MVERWISRLRADRTLRRVVWFWGVFYGLGYIVQFVASFILTDGSIGQAILFQIIVLVLCIFAVFVNVSVTLAVMSLFGGTSRSSKQTP
jgi:hypothetical protein